ncbi:unnamed protein product, partial [Adineta steineri]
SSITSTSTTITSTITTARHSGKRFSLIS